ncbi:MAG TPA: hypothetical protein VKX17_14875 [Planctomycetota bacterium]|nr:hypothetical protein [Planctomycetota bacterium]
MMLHNLRSWRHRADYNLREEFVESEATEQLKHAEEIHAAIDAFGLPKIIAYMIQHIRNLAQLRMGTSSI